MSDDVGAAMAEFAALPPRIRVALETWARCMMQPGGQTLDDMIADGVLISTVELRSLASIRQWFLYDRDRGARMMGVALAMAQLKDGE